MAITTAKNPNRISNLWVRGLSVEKSGAGVNDGALLVADEADATVDKDERIN
jgi:hypothetical protein